jgi:hypothetical protein
MDLHKKQILASLLLDSRLYMALSVKARRSFLSRLSDSYPTLFHAQVRDMSDDEMIGYEASWTGVDQRLR